MLSELDSVEKSLKEIATDIDNNINYHIKETHFKIGAKLHSKNFYYAKPLFQNSIYATVFAEKIVGIIKNEFKIPTGKNIILIGYEMYSEMLLSIVRKTLTKNGYYSGNIKHFVGIDNEGKFSFKPNEKESMFWLDNGLLKECFAVIIVPVASTGSTAVKIKDAIKKEVRKIVKPILRSNLEEKESQNFDEELENQIEVQISKINFSEESINVIAAQDNDKKFESIIEKNQRNLIKLTAKWYFPSECPYCFLQNAPTRTLFGTDKSYLTPALIFNNPKGKTVPNKNIDSRNDKLKDKAKITDIDTINFNNSLKYKRVKRNNEFFLFSVNSPLFIKNNESKIINWLKNLKKELKIRIEEKIVILAPCHETNSEFLNLVNEHVFDSKATIIYHQADVDYIENYKPLNEKLLNDATKVFYVDDNLISGSQFFAVYHLFRDTVQNLETTEEDDKVIYVNTLFGVEKRKIKVKKNRKSTNKKKLTGAILLRDSSTPETHDRFLRAVNQCRSFVAYNLPPALSFDSKKPLEHERKRFADLRQFALHDVLIKVFDNKEQELNVESDKEGKQTVKESKKEDMFKTTHKVFDYFTKNESGNFTFESLLMHCYSDKGSKDKENQITLLKVLTQYPFILYKPLKEKAFDWHKDWLNKFILPEKKVSSYKDFKELKFLIRRTVFLDNLQIVESSFLSILSGVFSFIEGELKVTKDCEEENNYNDFPIFLVRIYLELAHKNGWITVKLLKNIEDKEEDFKTESAKRFLRMLKIELVAVVNDFYETITRQYDRQWRDVFRDYKEFITDVSEIKSFFLKEDSNGYRERKKKLLETNKFDITKFVLNLEDKNSNDDIFAFAEIPNIKSFINFLWIKQLIFNDTYPRVNFLANVNCQQKIDAIVEKMEFFFSTNTVHAFFVVTDTKNIPYVMYDKDKVLYKFEDNTTLIDFLNGEDDKNKIAKETTAEYKRNGEIWEDCYNWGKKNIELKFLDKKANWLYLIRISELNDDEFITQGLLGFYSKDDLTQEFLPKQLLMLLRKDMSAFIKKHNKNDEFAELKQAELVKRLAYLAGHGRQTMQKLAKEDAKTFGNVVSTMEKLQYLFALKLLDNKGYTKDLKKQTGKELFDKIFFKKYPTYQELKASIQDIAVKIYSSEIVENEVALNSENIFNIPDETVETDKVKINSDILEMICFELIINAKKNRWNEEEENKITTPNKLKIEFEKDKDNIRIKTTSIGPKIDESTKDRINGGELIKRGYEISGLDLIREVAKFYNGKLSVERDKCICETKQKYQNTIIVTLKQEEE
jgi:hypothetical protein